MKWINKKLVCAEKGITRAVASVDEEPAEIDEPWIDPAGGYHPGGPGHDPLAQYE